MRALLCALLASLAAGSCIYDWTVPPAGDGGEGGGPLGGSGGAAGEGGQPEGGSAGSPGGMAGQGGVGGASECAPNGADDACTACVKMACCDELVACYGDANCTCWLGCFVNGGDCIAMCGAAQGEAQDMALCAGGACGGDCII